jgi:AbrB family looped-hinge helix DNA binding protein
MEKQKEIIITENGVYEKINDNGRIVIPHSQKKEIKNEKETTLDGIGRIQLSKNILQRMKIKNGDKLEVYASGKNVILKKLKIRKTETRENTMIIDDKYEIKVQISNLDFNTNHKTTTVDELGRILIWSEIRKKVNIIENDTLKVCVKDNMIILIPKRKC